MPARRPPSPGTTSGSWRRSAARCARLRGEPHHHVARLAGRVHPVAGVEPGEGDPERLRDLPDGDAEVARRGRGPPAPRAPASGRGSRARRRSRPGTARAMRRIRSASCGEHARVRPAQLHLDLLVGAAEAAREHRDLRARRRRASSRRRTAPSASCESSRSAFGASRTYTFAWSTPGTWPDERRADGRVGVRHLGVARATIATASSTLRRVYSSDEPGGVSTVRFTSLRSRDRARSPPPPSGRLQRDRADERGRRDARTSRAGGRAPRRRRPCSGPPAGRTSG